MNIIEETKEKQFNIAVEKQIRIYNHFIKTIWNKIIYDYLCKYTLLVKSKAQKTNK